MSQKVLLSANEAVAWAACKAGCSVAAAYPGTPSTEILENVAKFKDSINCEWAVNEKVGMEIAIGASIAGARALTAMKHVGLNVAMDPLMTYTYVGANGGLVVITADDPGMHSSQNEQDNRNLVKFARAPLFEPADSQETFDMVQAAFDVSEAYQVPAFVRLTTRTSHTSTVVDVGDAFGPGHVAKKPYVKDIRRNIPVPMFARPQRLKAQERTAALRDYACTSPFNRIEKGDARLGIITAGVTYQYVKDVFPEFTVLKLGFSCPLPAELITSFAASVDRVLVIEELDPFIEEQVRALGISVVEHTTELNMLEMNPMRLTALRKELLGDVEVAAVKRADAGLPTRPPVLCAGCGHRGVFFAGQAGRDGDGRHRVLHARRVSSAQRNGHDDLHGRLHRQRVRHGKSRAQGPPVRGARRLDVLPLGHDRHSGRALQRRQDHDGGARQPHHRHDRAPAEPRLRQDPMRRSRAGHGHRRGREGHGLQARGESRRLQLGRTGARAERGARLA